MYTASTSGSASSASYEPWACGMSHSRAYSAARSSVRLATATSSLSGDSFRPGMTAALIRAVDIKPHPTMLATLAG